MGHNGPLAGFSSYIFYYFLYHTGLLYVFRRLSLSYIPLGCLCFYSNYDWITTSSRHVGFCCVIFNFVNAVKGRLHLGNFAFNLQPSSFNLQLTAKCKRNLPFNLQPHPRLPEVESSNVNLRLRLKVERQPYQ